MTWESGLYEGVVVHTRFSPVEHRLRRRIVMLLVDLDRLDAIARPLRLFGLGRFALLGFRERDHGDGGRTPLKAQVFDKLVRAGVDPAGLRVRVLAMPRVLGFAFNPLTLYFCERPDGAAAAIIYEVNNTFGQRHSYVIPADAAGADIRQACGKAFYVSPFMDMDLAYAFLLKPPAEQVAVRIDVDGAQGRLLTATFAGEGEPLTDRAIARAVLRHPALALSVLAGIHWEAVKLWRKGLRLRHRAPGPKHGESLAPAARRAA